MPQLDLIDEAFVAAAPRRVAALVHDRTRWRGWWPDLTLAVGTDRGGAGIRWTVSGHYVGSSEIWVEPNADGAIVHYYLRIDPAAGPLPERAAARELRRRLLHAKRVLWAVKDELEAGRSVGDPATS